MDYTIYQKQELWERWVRQPIFLGKSTETAPRYTTILNFVEKGVIPFVRKKGYLLREKGDVITKNLLRYMFSLYLEEKVIFQNPHPEAFLEDIQEFDDQFDSIAVEHFWETWGFIQDFHEGVYAEKIRYTLPAFLWTQIDLENSPRVIQLERLFHEILEMENYEYFKQNPRAKDDPYLHDTSKVNYEDRHWH